LRALDALGARPLVDPDQARSFDGIRYVQEDGTTTEGRLPSPGLVVRRPALTAALATAALAAGARLRYSARVESHLVTTDRVEVELGDERIAARLLVAADGLHSPLRSAAGLDASVSGHGRRFGLRQHFRAPWPDRFVEVHFAG